MAVTDHDTVAGVKEALEAGEATGIRVVPGVEISTVIQGKDIHVLGYWIDIDDAQFLQRLEELRKVRDQRNEMILARLNELGLPLTMQDVIDSLSASKKPADTIGRPHIADAMVRKGYAASMADAFDRFLGTGAAAYVNPPRIEPETAVSWIIEAGGVAVLAHPGLYDQDELIPKLKAAGLAGLEAFHSDHSPEQEAHYASLAKAHDLVMTAGSDYHGERGGVVFHAPIGARSVTLDAVEQLYARRGAQL